MRVVTDKEKAELQRKRDEFLKCMSDVVTAVQELASSVGMPDPANALDDSSSFLDAVDLFLGTIDVSSLGWSQRARLKSRLVFFVGAVLTRLHGGTWFLQEDPNADFFMKTVVGGFDSDLSLIVDPAAIVHRVLSTTPAGCIRAEIANLGLDTSDTAPQLDINGLTGRHANLVPKIRCTCGRAIWDFSGSRTSRVTWLTEPDLDGLTQDIAKLVTRWVSAKGPEERRLFLEESLGLRQRAELDDTRVAHEVVALALASQGKNAYECEGCGRLWIETTRDKFVAYAAEGAKRNVLLPPTQETIAPPRR